VNSCAPEGYAVSAPHVAEDIKMW